MRLRPVEQVFSQTLHDIALDLRKDIVSRGFLPTHVELELADEYRHSLAILHRAHLSVVLSVILSLLAVALSIDRGRSRFWDFEWFVVAPLGLMAVLSLSDIISAWHGLLFGTQESARADHSRPSPTSTPSTGNMPGLP